MSEKPLAELSPRDIESQLNLKAGLTRGIPELAVEVRRRLAGADTDAILLRNRQIDDLQRALAVLEGEAGRVKEMEAALRSLRDAVNAKLNRAGEPSGTVMDRADEIAREVAQIGFKAVHLTEMPADDPGGCEGCEKGWCQSAVDAICDGRSQFEQAVIPAIAAALRDFAKEERDLWDGLEKCGIGVWETADGSWYCDLQSGPVATAETPREAVALALKRHEAISGRIREDGKEKP